MNKLFFLLSLAASTFAFTACDDDDNDSDNDAATSDAATSDAATSDAATSDAAMSDAATSDAATSDAATSDAATSDAATSDAATSDADNSDADNSDADNSDAATNDADDSDADDSDAETGEFTPCGGDITGEWTMSDTQALAAPGGNCLTFNNFVAQSTGPFKVQSDGQWSAEYSVKHSIESIVADFICSAGGNMSPELEDSTCQSLGASYNAQCEVTDHICTCVDGVLDITSSYKGTCTTSEHEMTCSGTLHSCQGETCQNSDVSYKFDYCVRGDTLTYRQGDHLYTLTR